MARIFGQGGYTGHLMESETLGELSHLERENFYVPFRRAMAWVEEHQPFDPTDPGPRFANDVHALVAEKLGIEDLNEVKFFTAVGSPLDHFHGIDGFFRIKTRGKEFVVTLDVTINPAKGKEYKADILIFIPPQGLDPREDRAAYLEKIGEVAEEITDRIESLT